MMALSSSSTTPTTPTPTSTPTSTSLSSNTFFSFQKPFSTISITLLKSSHAKKLRKAIMLHYPDVTSQTLGNEQALFEEKIGKHVYLYYVKREEPIFFIIDDGERGKNMFPTLWTMWRHPKMMRGMIIHAPVSRFLIKGAHLMLPGVETFGHTQPYEKWSTGEVRAVFVKGNTKAMAIGKMTIDTQHIYTYGWKGMAMEIIHVYKDQLWKRFGEKPQGFQTNTVETMIDQGDNVEQNQWKWLMPKIQIKEEKTQTQQTGQEEKKHDKNGEMRLRTAEQQKSVAALEKQMRTIEYLKNKATRQTLNTEEQNAVERQAEIEKQMQQQQQHLQLLQHELKTCENWQADEETGWENAPTLERRSSETSTISDWELIAHDDDDDDDDGDEKLSTPEMIESDFGRTPLDSRTSAATQLLMCTTLNDAQSSDLLQQSLSATPEASAEQPDCVEATLDDDASVDHSLSSSELDSQTHQTAPSVSAAEMDDAFRQALLYTIRQTDPSQLPISLSILSSFFDRYSPAPFKLDIKHSSYKKLSSFVKLSQKEGLLKTKIIRGGDILIQTFDYNHADVAATVISPAYLSHLQQRDRNRQSVSEVQHQQQHFNGSVKSSKVAVYLKYKPSTSLAKLLSPAISKMQLYYLKEIKDALWSYAAEHELSSGANIRLNEPLSQTFHISASIISKSELSKLVELETLTYYTISNVPDIDDCEFTKGNPPSISIIVETKHARKHTRITNLEAYCIDVEQFASDNRKAFACSVSVQDAVGDNSRKPSHEIVVQGHVADKVKALLHSEYGVPQQFITVKSNIKSKK